MVVNKSKGIDIKGRWYIEITDLDVRPSGDQWCVARNYYDTYEEREKEFNKIKVYTEKEARRK